MNITKEQIRAAGGIVHADGNVFFTSIEQLITIMRGLEDAEPPGCASNCETCTYHHQSPSHAGYCYMFYEEPNGVCGQWKDATTSPQAAQTALQSESLAQAAQALAQPPSEGKTIEALAPIQAAQTEAQNGCLSNCRNCQHFRRDTGGHCYMFKEEPQGVCAQFKASWAFW